MERISSKARSSLKRMTVLRYSWRLGPKKEEDENIDMRIGKARAILGIRDV
jgi:hypothetical protein